MRIIKCPDAKALDRTVAQMMVDMITSMHSPVIGLSTGRTTKGIHHAVRDLFIQAPFDVSSVTFFDIDEITGVSEDYWGACSRMLKDDFIDALKVPEENLLFLPNEVEDVAILEKEYRSAIDAKGGVDMLVLGLGENGHLGFNQPGTPFGAGMAIYPMLPELDARVHRDTGIPTEVFLGGLTWGIKDIMNARSIVLPVKGKAKAIVLKALLYGPVTEALPASVLQLHPNLTVVVDVDAASEL